MKGHVALLEAIQTKEAVGGLTHDFYRYPARFSPKFVRATIECFTSPGDTVLDPFMGSGTTLVEARVMGRNCIGTDISSLAVFIAKTKTTLLSKGDAEVVREWACSLGGALNLRNPISAASHCPNVHYQRNIRSKSTWAIRKTIHQALTKIATLPRPRQRNFARCVLLRAAQWALDCREEVPAAHELRAKFSEFLEQMLIGAREFAKAVKAIENQPEFRRTFTICLHRSAVGLDTESLLKDCDAPALIVTSPPYPGVHVLYHRWQVLGRRETPAPFWIANCQDGRGASFYTMGDRKQPRLVPYFTQIFESFRSLSRICGRKTLVVQMLAFSEPSWQLPEYLRMMELAGFKETRLDSPANGRDGRVWRSVPNRKWYADQRGSTASSTEVVLCHRLSSGK
jgi:hypothetical protein